MAVVNRHMAVPIAIWRLEVAPHPGSGAISALAVLIWRLSLALLAVYGAILWRQQKTRFWKSRHTTEVAPHKTVAPLKIFCGARSWRQLTTATAILIGANVYLMAPFMWCLNLTLTLL